ncbi:NUDIX domain-containing protein [Paenibacillus silviterrae]|uniref:NUDIX domain-containing protein n=1 Tax=Paenibacillus silviterrae TaxID=3242194 RepID=UPI0025427646|nr:NUDIX domain-containing protein [Paenibacillus chinjuensis]
MFDEIEIKTSRGMAVSNRPRVCAVIIKDDHILMVLHDHGDRSYWTLPGGGVEEGETLEAAVLREVKEEVNLNGTIVRLLFEDAYTNGPEYCFLVQVTEDEKEAELGYDPELLPEDQVLKGIAWFTLTEKKDDKQVKRVLQTLGD